MKKGGVVIRRDKMRFRSSERDSARDSLPDVNAEDGSTRPSWTNPTYRNPE